MYFQCFLYYRYISTYNTYIHTYTLYYFLSCNYQLRFFPLKRFFLGDGWATYLLNTSLYGPSSPCMFITLFYVTVIFMQRSVMSVACLRVALVWLHHKYVTNMCQLSNFKGLYLNGFSTGNVWENLKAP